LPTGRIHEDAAGFASASTLCSLTRKPTCT
jgi:hypothetical protein